MVRAADGCTFSARATVVVQGESGVGAGRPCLCDGVTMAVEVRRTASTTVNAALYCAEALLSLLAPVVGESCCPCPRDITMRRAILALSCLTWSAAVGTSLSPPDFRTAVPAGGSSTVTGTPSAPDSNSTLLNVQSFGAVGDGVTDDTPAFAAAFAALAASPRGATVYMPAGLYLLTSTLTLTPVQPFTLRGDGWLSNLLWSADSDLLLFNATSPVAHATIADFAVSSTGGIKSPSSTALRFPAGLVRSLVSNVLFYGAGAIPGSSIPTFLTGSNLDLGDVTDTVTLRDVLHWFVGGTGVRIGRGSEVRIMGGRIIGPGTRTDGSVGVHVTGNNGGVHIVETDVIALGTGVLLDASSGAGSNREIFITHATMDSDGVGLHIVDNSYVSVAGLWAASSDTANILLDSTATGAILVVVGGTIFNGGVLKSSCAVGGCDGIVARAGSFQLTGVDIRNNRGTGVSITTAQVSNYVINSCRISSNGQGMALNGSGYSVIGNVFSSNTAPSDFGPQTGGAVVTANVNPTQ